MLSYQQAKYVIYLGVNVEIRIYTRYSEYISVWFKLNKRAGLCIAVSVSNRQDSVYSDWYEKTQFG